MQLRFMKLIRLNLSLILAVIFASCGKDVDPDFVGESVGTYSYTTDLLRANKSTPDNVVGTLTLTRNEDLITLVINDVEPVKSSRLELTSNGYVFKIEAATLTDSDGDLVDRTGLRSITLNGTIFHGQYDALAKQLSIKAAYTYQDSRYSSYNFTADVKATKK